MRRTDDQLQRDVLEELRWEPSLNAAHIGVAAEAGVVTLTGHVETYSEKVDAEKAAKRVVGVRGLANELEVRLPSALVRDDTEVAEAVLRSLEWNVLVPIDRIRPTVTRGWVTLEGEVDWNFQRQAAFRTVKTLTGVKGVTNKIVLRPRVDPRQIREKIEAAFQRSAELDAYRVKVEADGGAVTLRGTVTSWTEHEKAALAAWAAPGVTEVVNRIQVEETEPAFA